MEVDVLSLDLVSLLVRDGASNSSATAALALRCLMNPGKPLRRSIYSRVQVILAQLLEVIWYQPGE
jgi:hypothetical protein